MLSRTRNSDGLPEPRPKAHSEQSRHRPNLDQHKEAMTPEGGVPHQAPFWGWLRGQRPLQGSQEFTGKPRRQHMADSCGEHTPRAAGFTGGVPSPAACGPTPTRPGSGVNQTQLYGSPSTYNLLSAGLFLRENKHSGKI